ncbi:MAG: tape measure protein [Bacteroidota bacterium]
MADEVYRNEIIIELNDSEVTAKAPQVEKRINAMLDRMQRRAQVLSRERIAPIIDVRDRFTEKALGADKLIKKLGLEQASPVIAVQDRASAVATRLSAMLEAIEANKLEVAAGMKGPLMEELSRARQALGALGDVKAGPVAELRGRLFSDIGRAEGLLRDLDGMSAAPKATLLDRVTASAVAIGGRLGSLTSRAWIVVIRAKDTVTGTLGRVWRAVTSPLGLLGMGVGGAALTAATIAAPLRLAGSMEQAKIGFETMLGSAEKAGKFLRDLQRFAALTPFEFPELQDASKRLLAFGFRAEEILPTMTAIGNAASGLGIGAEGVNRLILAIGQMRAKAKVSGEEMRQLTEAGIPAWEMLAKAMGKTTAQVMKMSEKGLIPAGKAIDILVRGMNERFPNMMERQSRSLFGLWSTIKDTFNMSILFRWGDGLSKAIKPRLERLVDLFTKNEDVVNRWGDTLERIALRAGDRVMTILERSFNKVDALLNDERFQKADLFGKTQILWEEIITKPFEQWWNAGGAEWVTAIGGKVGAALVKGIADVASTNPLVAALIGGYVGGPWGALVGFGFGTGGWVGSRLARAGEKPRSSMITLDQIARMAEARRNLQENPVASVAVPRPVAHITVEPRNVPAGLSRQRKGQLVSVPSSGRRTIDHVEVAAEMSRPANGLLRRLDVTQTVAELLAKEGIAPSLPGYAQGGIVRAPHIAKIAERGPEAIIPLAPWMRERSFTLLRQTERILSADEAPETRPVPVAAVAAGRTTVVHVHMEDIVRTIQVNNVREAAATADEVGAAVATRLKDILTNLAS